VPQCDPESSIFAQSIRRMPTASHELNTRTANLIARQVPQVKFVVPCLLSFIYAVTSILHRRWTVF
jgi:hypothetical protein